MKNTKTLFLLLCLCSFTTLTAQISINTDNSDPDPSAMLDIKSSDKGILVPRLTTAQRTAVSNPASGLLVYDSSTNSFWFYSGTAWTELTSATVASSIQDTDSDTKIQVEKSPDEDSIRIDIAGVERMVIRQNPTGVTLINLPNNAFNTFIGQDAGQATSPDMSFQGGLFNNFIGYQAGYNNTVGSGNVFNGYLAGRSNTVGQGNIFIGSAAGFDNTIGRDNIFSGSGAGFNNTTGSRNIFNGYVAGTMNTTGKQNVFTGSGAGFSNTTGDNNVYLGYQSGHSNAAGSANVFLGANAGYDEAGSNKLYIENSNSITPLIYGEFDNDIVKIHGTLGIKDEYTFPIVKGTAGQVLQTDGAGNTTWATSSIQTLVADVDNDTKIQVEKNVDEDVIRFDLGGSERMVLKQSPTGATQIHLPNNNFNTFLGEEAGTATMPTATTGKQNSFIGYKAGNSNTTGNTNVFLGYRAGEYNTSGKLNIFNGSFAGWANQTGNSNVFIGTISGRNNTTGNFNVFIGDSSGNANATGNNNTYIGHKAGFDIASGSNNICLGNNSGTNGTFSNRLYIENATSSTPLIYGEFDNDIVKIYGTLSIKDEYTFPIIKGTIGQVLQTDGSGNTAWATPTANTDNQKADLFTLNGNNLELSLENDGETPKSVDLSSLNTDAQKADVFNLNGTTLELSLENDGEFTKTVDLSSFNNTDNQKADVFALNGNNLELSLENDGEATHSIDLSSINATKTLLADADNNTIIQVEESGNEDKVRIDLAGSERVLMEQSATGATLISLPNNNFNTFLGQDAGQATTQAGGGFFDGSENCFIGYRAGYFNTSGYQNTFTGYHSGYFNTTGTRNVFLGSFAGQSNTTGAGNTFIGFDSGSSNTTGASNLFCGRAAGINNTNGHSNSFIGYEAGYSNESGTSNTFLGSRAGYSSTGSNNIFIGFQAGQSETASNKLYIENSHSTIPLIYGEFDNDVVIINGQLSSTNILYPNAGIRLPGAYDPNSTNVGTAGNYISFGHIGVSEDFLGYESNAFYFKDSEGGADVADPNVFAASFLNYSSRRWKHNIKKMNNALSIIQQLQGVTYTWNKDRGHHDDFGFIAEEVHQVLPQIAQKGADGQVDGVAYGKITPYLVEAIKEQQAQIEQLQNENQQLKNNNQTMQSDIQQLKAAVFGHAAAQKKDE